MFGASAGSWSNSKKKSNFFPFRCGLKPWAVLLHLLIKIRSNNHYKKKETTSDDLSKFSLICFKTCCPFKCFSKFEVINGVNV
jgi:hypothetical protein